jgi:hypothetical protein
LHWFHHYGHLFVQFVEILLPGEYQKHRDRLIQEPSCQQQAKPKLSILGSEDPTPLGV